MCSGEDELNGTELMPLNQVYARSAPCAEESVAVKAASAAAAAAVAAPPPASASSSAASTPTGPGAMRKDVNGVVDPLDLDTVSALILSPEDPFKSHDAAGLRADNGE